MNEQYLQRIQNVIARYPSNTLFPEFVKGANQCPSCNKRGKFYVYDNGVKCFSSSCDLHKFRDVIKFNADRKGISYHQSLLELEKVAGLKQNEFDDRHKTLTEVLNVYHHYLFLPEAKEALQYLLNRGFLKEFLMHYMIGYAPPFNVLQAYGLNKQELIENKLLDNRHNDYFRNRIIFPIYSRTGQLMHLNGRYLGDISLDCDGEPVHPRYKCTKTVKNNKITQFLLLEQNINTYIKRKKVILTEGCTDTFTLYQYGLPVLGMMGVERLSSHYYKLKDIPTVYCVFDNDRFDLDHPLYPNQYKSWSRILPSLIDLQMLLPDTDFRIWTVPPELGKDINDYFKQGTFKQNIKRLYEDSVDLLDFLLEEYKYDFSRHIEIARLFKIKNKDLDKLNNIIPKDFSYTDYLLKIL